MNCDRAHAGLSAGRVGPATRDHVEHCAACAAWADALDQVRLGAPALVGVPPAGLSDRVLSGLAAKEPSLSPVAPASAAVPPPAADAPPPSSGAHDGAVVRPGFWRPAAQKFVASLAAASLVAAAVVLTWDREPSPAMALAAAVDTLADEHTTYRFSVEGKAEARFTPEGLPPSPLEMQPPPAPRMQRPDPLPAPPPPPSGAADGFSRGMHEWAERVGEHFSAYGQEMEQWAQRMSDRVAQYGEALERAMRDHAQDWEAYADRVRAQLEAYDDDLRAQQREHYGSDLPWTPTHVTVAYTADGFARGDEERRTRLNYSVQANGGVAAITRRVETVERDRRAYAMDRDLPDAQWADLGVNAMVRLSPLLDVDLPQVLAALRAEGDRAERVEDRERDGETFKGYRVPDVSGADVQAWLDGEGRLRELRIREQVTQGVVRRSADTTFRFDDYGVELPPLPAPPAIPLPSLPMDLRPAVIVQTMVSVMPPPILESH